MTSLKSKDVEISTAIQHHWNNRAAKFDDDPCHGPNRGSKFSAGSRDQLRFPYSMSVAVQDFWLFCLRSSDTRSLESTWLPEC